jgi:endonuclease YncB( thermonuclease family)
VLALGAVLLLAAAAVAEPLTIRGTPEVLDGRRMVVAGRDIVLADIEVPALGTPCRIRGNPLDCGRLARAGLMDLVAGGDVVCSAVGHGGHRCFAGRYDVAFGLVHAGWAVPTENAPTHYDAKMTQAAERGRGLWSAQPAPKSLSRRD